MHRYRVISPLDHDLVAYPVGAIITCDDQLAASLIDKGVIWPETDHATQATQFTALPPATSPSTASDGAAAVGQQDAPADGATGGGTVPPASAAEASPLPPPMPPAATDQTGAGAAEGKAAPASAPASKPRAKRTKA
ncbi:hypothetical protein [Elioraea sp.]|jgi:hypothetical protein|uniref:hypothetical protein n=1 Tax=Elioraea sp. TaxID=2185103 RepID=UPI0025BE6939|nr:hypothetical protein [Elioraea sp.]